MRHILCTQCESYREGCVFTHGPPSVRYAIHIYTARISQGGVRITEAGQKRPALTSSHPRGTPAFRPLPQPAPESSGSRPRSIPGSANGPAAPAYPTRPLRLMWAWAAVARECSGRVRHRGTWRLSPATTPPPPSRAALAGRRRRLARTAPALLRRRRLTCDLPTVRHADTHIHGVDLAGRVCVIGRPAQDWAIGLSPQHQRKHLWTRPMFTCEIDAPCPPPAF